ncbi:Phospho-2-dehydro-3-deoxyheptonate aldolase [compost metagenome]
MADPSHGTGRRELVVPIARAAVAAGADGIMVEVHRDPTQAKSDGPQSLYPEQFRTMMSELERISLVMGKPLLAGPAAVSKG